MLHVLDVYLYVNNCQKPITGHKHEAKKKSANVLIWNQITFRQLNREQLEWHLTYADSFILLSLEVALLWAI